MRRRQITKISLLLAGILTIVILLVIMATGILPVKASELQEGSEVYISIPIQKGDSLWSVAEEYRPEGISTRDYMKKIASLNNLHLDAELHQGGYLMVAVREKPQQNPNPPSDEQP